MADAVRDKIEAVLAELRPFFQSDGGDVEFVEMTPAGGWVYRWRWEKK